MLQRAIIIGAATNMISLDEYKTDTATSNNHQNAESINALPLKYNYRGQLVHNGYTFSMHSRNGRTCLVNWRCTSYAKTRCGATIKTEGKTFLSIKGNHNHFIKYMPTTFTPQVYK